MDHDHAVPNLVVMLAQAAANFMESYYVGLLGLAGAALVFPLVILIQTMSSGGMGAELPPRSLAR
jgi:Na+-driven multidrug efflux pump